MNEVYLIRHAEKDDTTDLTKKGELEAHQLSAYLPIFDKVYASSSSRTQQTAKLLTGKEPAVDVRAGFAMAPQHKSDAINNIARRLGITFLEASLEYNDSEVSEGIEKQATELNRMIDSLLANAGDNIYLVVSHDLSISPALAQRGIALESIDYLNGYIIRSDGSISHFKPHEIDK